jgi:c-di-GMP-binding flagellar brake protein YcgR
MGKERRRFQRVKHRVSCQYICEGRASAGFLADISARGMQIQCSGSAPAPGASIALTFRDANGAVFRVDGRVARRRASHRSAAVVEMSSFGVELISAPEAFYALVTQVVARGAGDSTG